TQPMFNMGGMDFVQMAPHDRLPVRRYNFSVNHVYKLGSGWQLRNTVFAYTTSRNFQRQNFSMSDFDNNGNLIKPNDFNGVIWGDTTVKNGAVLMRNSNAHRNRQFEVAGAESRISHEGEIFGFRNQFDAGVRYIYERANEQFVEGRTADASAGMIRDFEIRTGQAFSAFAQDKINITRRASVTAGIRMESYDYSRNILRGRFRINNVQTVVDTNIFANNNLLKFIPGIGANYNINSRISIYGGIHRGFAPPRIKDAITPEGVTMELDPELSWNSELGTRANIKKGINAEVTLFHMIFSNQIVPAALSIGGGGTGVVNAGPTEHKGIEGGVNLDFGKILDTKYAIRYDANVTYVDSRYAAERLMTQGADTLNVQGNILPYAPKLFLSSALEVETPFGLGARMVATYVGNQFTDPLNMVEPTADGRRGEIPAYYVFDGNLFYTFKNFPATLNLAAKNLTNERYIANRRPQGIRLGMPRMIIAGIDIKF
ncbi:MAG: TonB-dependent receptor family protein, partial [Cytophagaceae bacterium]